MIQAKQLRVGVDKVNNLVVIEIRGHPATQRVLITPEQALSMGDELRHIAKRFQREKGKLIIT